MKGESSCLASNRLISNKFDHHDLFPPSSSIQPKAALIAGFTVAVLVTLDLSNTAREESGVEPTKISYYWKSMFHITA